LIGGLMFKKVRFLIILALPLNSYASSFWSPDSDTALLIDLLATSQQAFRATLELIETESKTLDRIEQVQVVVEERHNKVLEAAYLTEATIELGKNINNIDSMSSYIGKINEVAGLKDASTSYYKSIRLRDESKKKSDKVVADSTAASIKAKKFKDRVTHKGYSGRSASTKAGIDSARSSSVLVDQMASNNLILSQIYNQNSVNGSIEASKERLQNQMAIDSLVELGVVAKSKERVYAHYPSQKSKRRKEIINMSNEDMKNFSQSSEI
jgi:hypothetical protein